MSKTTISVKHRLQNLLKCKINALFLLPEKVQALVLYLTACENSLLGYLLLMTGRLMTQRLFSQTGALH